MPTQLLAGLCRRGSHGQGYLRAVDVAGWPGHRLGHEASCGSSGVLVAGDAADTCLVMEGKRLRWAGLALGVWACVAGCGNSAHSPAAASASARASAGRAIVELSVPRPAPTHMAAARVLARSEAALEHVRSFHFDGGGFDAHGVAFSLSGDVVPGQGLESSSVNGLARYSERLIGHQAYVNGNARYWTNVGVPPTRVLGVAGRWVREPVTSVPAGVRALASSNVLGHCWLSLSHTKVMFSRYPVVKTSTGTAWELVQQERWPGTATAQLSLNAKAPWLPITITQEGSNNPPDETCGETTTSESPQDIHFQFTGFDRPVHLATPPAPISLAAFRRQITTPGIRPPRPSRHTSHERRQITELDGTWVMTGRFIASENFAGEQAGTTGRRIWRISSGCRDGVCQVTLYRMTNGGLLVAGLGWTGTQWTASFDNQSTCADGSVHPTSDRMTLALVGSQLTAVEHVHSENTCGAPATSTMVWYGHRSLRPAGTPGAD